MADNKSCEGKMTTLECMECGFREVFTERQFKLVDGLKCCICEGLVTHRITRPDEPIRNRRMKEKDFKQLYGNNKVRLGGTDSSSSSDLSIKVDIDVSDALTGLKAVQREARKATAELKKLEAQQDQMVDLPFHPEVTT